MAVMYPKNISEYLPEDSERIVYLELKNQLPDSFEVFYSVKWTTYKKGKLIKSEADFIIASPDYGFLCLEVKGGDNITVDGDNNWRLIDHVNGDRDLKCSPYDQAEKNMYYFQKLYGKINHIPYSGIYASAVIFPFYAFPENIVLDNRHRICTIDCNDTKNLYDRIKKIFRLWAGSTYGFRVYQESQHRALLEIIRKKLAISAAAGALVKYKDNQLRMINRVQDNYVYFLSNVRRFYIRGGAGTGKTWIAMKMALQEAHNKSKRVLFLCTTQTLRNAIENELLKQQEIGSRIKVYSVDQLIEKLTPNFEDFSGPLYEGIEDSIIVDEKYDAIFIDEAQDFTEEWARITKRLLVSSVQSRFGVFYDDVQVLRKDSFRDGFGIESKPYLLHENIRNTANIYYWTSEKTNLGTDVIANPVEGPTPVTEEIRDQSQLIHRLESLFKQFLIDEHLTNDSLVLITENSDALIDEFPEGIAKWKFTKMDPVSENEIKVASVEEYKGLEANMVIYIHSDCVSNNMNYIAYTRAKYYLIELIRR
jgi:hypothetical protein